MAEKKFMDGARVCPYERTITLIGNKWSLLILRDLTLSKEPLRFNQFLRSLKPISSKTLSSKLKDLVESGVVSREVISSVPVKVQYSLTEMGKDLSTVLDAMADWSVKWKLNKC